MTNDKREMLLRLGAEARWMALKEEEKELLEILGPAFRKAHTANGLPKKRIGRPPVSEAVKRAVGNRMKRRWAERSRGNKVGTTMALITEFLKSNKDEKYNLEQVYEGIKNLGWKTNSSDPRGVLSVTLRKDGVAKGLVKQHKVPGNARRALYSFGKEE